MHVYRSNRWISKEKCYQRTPNFLSCASKEETMLIHYKVVDTMIIEFLGVFS